MATTEENIDIQQESDNGINIKEILFICLSKWYWILLSVIICMGIGILYVLRTPSVYTTSAQIIIKTDSKSGASELDNFSDISTFQTNSSLSNEIATLVSPDLMRGVVDQLKLNMNYSIAGRWHDVVLYGTSLPITATLYDIGPEQSASFSLKIGKDSILTLSDFNSGSKAYDKTIKTRIGYLVNTPIGRVSIQPTKAYRGEYPDEINISCSTVKGAVGKYASELAVRQDEKSSVVIISVSDVSTERAADIINSLIVEYNKKWIDDKNQIAISTSNFIDERLAVIESELGNVDSDISSYKSANLLPDVQAASGMYMQQANQANSEIMELNNQLYMANYVKQYLSNENSKNQLLPANAGFETSSINSQVTSYNQLILNRNSLVANSSENSPLVQDIDRNIADLRRNIIMSVDNQIETLRARIRTQQQSQGRAISHIASNPQQAKYLLSVERQQKVKESLYLYLLQKREENELSQTFTAYNTRVIVAPDGGAKTAPNSRNIYLLSFVIGLAIPISIIVLRSILNSSVRGRRDLESLTVPFVGEIPQMSTYKKKGFFKRKKKQNEKNLIAVKEGSRNVINEAFRVVRANLEFMSGSNKVIAITSANPGSGKTFITYNLAKSFAIKGKRVLTIDLDLRKGSLSKYMPETTQGFTDYIVNRADNIEDLIIKDKNCDNLYMLPMGTMPPNPTELLYSPNFAKLLDRLRGEYDLIFIDCPPIEIVADASIIDKQVDMTIFIIRAGLFERSMLKDVQKFYNTGKYTNLSIILNGTEAENHYGYRYGYRYGYHYGYAYGNYGGYTSDK